MIFRSKYITAIAEAIAEDVAAELLDGLTDCPFCHCAGELYTRTERGSFVLESVYKRRTGKELPELIVLRGFCVHCGRTSTGLEMLATIRGQTVTELIFELAGDYCEPRQPSSMYASRDAAIEAEELTAEELHRQIVAVLAIAEQEGADNAEAAEILLELRELERALAVTKPEQAREAWEHYRHRAVSLLERRRKPE